MLGILKVDPFFFSILKVEPLILRILMVDPLILSSQNLLPYHP